MPRTLLIIKIAPRRTLQGQGKSFSVHDEVFRRRRVPLTMLVEMDSGERQAEDHNLAYTMNMLIWNVEMVYIVTQILSYKILAGMN